ncbi:hypothetical protein ABVK25_005156 [Lepraria finkii]|uniref:Uncharacterized protein n=1 Tax=Lepraria finkii TaxID=1340010 RepID=A0ABR4BAG3_9LECA
MASNDNFISRTVQNGVATAGGYAGGVVDAAGKSVSGAGRNVGNSVTNAANTAGGSASNYGNGIKDATKAGGPRTQTAQNPIGLSSNSYGGRKVVTGGGSKESTTGNKGTASNPLGLS